MTPAEWMDRGCGDEGGRGYGAAMASQLANKLEKGDLARGREAEREEGVVVAGGGLEEASGERWDRRVRACPPYPLPTSASPRWSRATTPL